MTTEPQKFTLGPGDRSTDDFRNAAWPLRAFAILLLLTAGVLSARSLWTLPSPALHYPQTPLQSAGISVLLILGCAFSVEVGRLLEGRVTEANRAHKGLSAWAMASTFLLPSVWWMVVVAACYADVRWRSLRVPLWKWVISAALILISAHAAAFMVQLTLPDLWLGSGATGIAVAFGSAMTFLLFEAGLFQICAWLSHPADERWLRGMLRQPSFYFTEGSVLILGLATGLLGRDAPWFVLLLVPIWGLMQQAALQQPLQEQALIDAKTQTLRYEPWRRMALEETSRLRADGGGWAVLFADLDRFKDFNDRHGHLAGDRALAATANALQTRLREGDLLARFGGEEFVILLRNAGPSQAVVVADALREAVRRMSQHDLPEPLTISVGVASTETASGDRLELIEAVLQADKAMYRAKLAGRDRTRT